MRIAGKNLSKKPSPRLEEDLPGTKIRRHTEKRNFLTVQQFTVEIPKVVFHEEHHSGIEQTNKLLTSYLLLSGI